MVCSMFWEVVVLMLLVMMWLWGLMLMGVLEEGLCEDMMRVYFCVVVCLFVSVFRSVVICCGEFICSVVVFFFGFIWIFRFLGLSMCIVFLFVMLLFVNRMFVVVKCFWSVVIVVFLFLVCEENLSMWCLVC